MHAQQVDKSKLVEQGKLRIEKMLLNKGLSTEQVDSMKLAAKEQARQNAFVTRT